MSFDKPCAVVNSAKTLSRRRWRPPPYAPIRLNLPRRLICQGLLARLEAAVSEWIRVGQRNDCVSGAEIAKVKESLARMRRLLEKDEFDEIKGLTTQIKEILAKASAKI